MSQITEHFPFVNSTAPHAEPTKPNVRFVSKAVTAATAVVIGVTLAVVAGRVLSVAVDRYYDAKIAAFATPPIEASYQSAIAAAHAADEEEAAAAANVDAPTAAASAQ